MDDDLGGWVFDDTGSDTGGWVFDDVPSSSGGSSGEYLGGGKDSASSGQPTYSGSAPRNVTINGVTYGLDTVSGLTGLLRKFISSPAALAGGAAGLYGLLGGNDPNTGGYKGSIPRYTAKREVIPQPEYQPYTGKPVMGRQMFTDTKYEPVAAAQGGIMPKPRYLKGHTDGMADEINTSIDDRQPAKLSHGEFVIPADVVSHLGNGNSDAGAKALYKMMERVRKARTGNPKQGKQINPEKFTPGGIAKYAQGGQVQRFNTGGGATAMSSMPANPAGGINPGATTSSNLAEWAGPYITEMLGRGWALSSEPYQTYTGPLTAGYSPLQEKYFTGLGNLGFPSQLGKSFTDTGVMQSYMNPYMQQVLQPQMQAMQRQSDIQRSTLGANIAKSGAFGGARAGLMGQQLNAELMRQQQQATGQAYQNAFTQGLGQFNTEQNQAQSLANMLGAAGGQQRTIEQEGINALMKQFDEQRKAPYAQLQFMQSLLQGLPTGSTVVTPNTTTMQKIGQAGGQAADFYKWLTDTFPGLK